MSRLFKIDYNIGAGDKMQILTYSTPNAEPLAHDMTNDGSTHTFTETSDGELWYKYSLVIGDGKITEPRPGEHDRDPCAAAD